MGCVAFHYIVSVPAQHILMDIWVVSNLLFLQTAVGWALPLATRDYNCRGDSWEWNCWVKENML